jgi:RNA polymerase sigma-70 factor (family 1)
MDNSGNSERYNEEPNENVPSRRGPAFRRDDDHPSPNSEMLVKKAFEQDASRGIALLFQWYYRPLCSHAIRFVSSREIAEDIVSDVFYKFHSEKLFEGIQSSYRAYLFTAVRHRAFDYVRTEMKRATSIQHAEYVEERSDQQPDHITQYEDLYKDVENAINSLPVKRRKIYLMHRFEGRKYQEIATELNLSLRTVEAQMYQALHQVRKMIRDKWLLVLLLFIQ